MYVLLGSFSMTTDATQAHSGVSAMAILAMEMLNYACSIMRRMLIIVGKHAENVVPSASATDPTGS